MIVIKRNGEKEKFQKDKIIKAIQAAMKEVNSEIYDTDIAHEIANKIEWLVFNNRPEISIEEIQDLVEELLMQSKELDVAKAYIRFRYKREVAREHKADFMQAYSEKLEARNIQNQNANIDEQSFGGRMGEANSLMTKQYALDFCVSPMAKKNHLENMIYIHDLDSYAVGMHNCLSVPFDKLLANGFNTRQTDVRPAGSVNTAMQLVAVIFQLQSLQQFGGVSATHLDWTMVPYVRKSFRKHWNDGLKYVAFWDVSEENYEKEDLSITEYCDCDDYEDVYKYALDMTKKEIHQAVEGLYHNLNTLQSRSGNQLKWMVG